MIALIFINNILFVNDKKEPIQPVSGKLVPRYAGPSTFASIPELRDVDSWEVAIISVPLVTLPGNKFLKHALEWDYFLGVITFYLLTYLMWKKKDN